MAKKKRETQTWVLTFEDGSTKEIEIGNVSVLKFPTKQVVLHIDRRPDGKHLLVVSQDIVEEGTKLQKIDIIRSSSDE